MAEEEQSRVLGTELPSKRAREEEEVINGVSSVVEMADSVNNNNSADGQPLPRGISSVIPGWFSEISPMWPGPLLLLFTVLDFIFIEFCFCLRFIFCWNG